MIGSLFRGGQHGRVEMKKETGTPGNAPDTRERILQTASELFYREGTRAVGVDLIVAQAGVAKTSLYRYFTTKDDLIEAFLLREDADFWAHWDAVAAQYRRTPREELDAQLQWIGERIARPAIAAARRSTSPPNTRTATIRPARWPSRTSRNCGAG